MNDKTLHRKLKIEQHEVIPLKTRGYPCGLYEYSYNIDILQSYTISCVCLFKNLIYPPLLGLWLRADEIPEMPIYEILIPNLKKSEWCGKKLCCWLIYWYHIGFVVKLWLLYYMTDLIAKTAYLSEVNGPLHWGRIYLTSDGIIISGIELMYGPIILDISF